MFMIDQAKIVDGAEFTVLDDQFLDPSDGREAAIIAANTKLIIRECMGKKCLVEFDDGEQAGQTLYVPTSNISQLDLSA